MIDNTRMRSELSVYEWSMLEEWRDNWIAGNHEYLYSVRVGKGVSTEGVEPEWLAKCIKANSRLKIDCVVYDDEKPVEIVEVKKVARLDAIGQIESYKYLIDLEYGVDVDKLILCNFASGDVKMVCEKFGIELMEISVSK